MKRLFKHLFQTIFLVGLAWIVIKIPQNPNMHYWNMAIWGSIFALLIGVAIYLYRCHRKGTLKCFTLLLITLGVTSNALAYQTVTCENEISVTAETSGCPTDSGASSYYQCLLKTYRAKYDTDESGAIDKTSGHLLDFCAESRAFDADKYIEENKEPDEEIIRQAVRYSDAYDRAAAAGVAEKSGSFKRWLGFFMSDAEEQDTCAKSYLDKIAEYKKKKYEQKTKIVQTLLEAEKGKCWPCGIAHTMIYAVEKITLSLEDTLSDAALKLLGIMFLFWILVKVLLLIGQFGTANNAEFFTEFLIRSILAVIAAAILTTSMGEVYKLTFSPLVDATFSITDKILDPYKSTDQSLGTQLAGSTNLGCTCCPDDSDYSEDSDCNSDSKGVSGKISECKVTYSNGSEGIGIFEKKTKQRMLCTVCKIYKQTAPLVASGRVLLYESWKNGKEAKGRSLLGDVVSWFSTTYNALSHMPYPFCMWVLAIALIVCFSWLTFVISFRLIDIFLRIGFAIILTPFLVTAFVFPISRQYTKRGWDFLVHAVLSIMALGLGISLVIAAFMTSLPGSSSQLKTLIQQTDPDAVNDYAEKLMNAFGVDKDKGGTWYMTFYLLMVCFFGINIIKASQTVIEGLSGLTCGIPSIAGAAVMGAVRAALAPFRMVKNILLDRLENLPGGGLASSAIKAVDPTEAAAGVSGDSGSRGAFAAMGKFTGEAAGRTAETVQKGVGWAEEGLGKGATKLGGMLTGTFVGSIFGVPLIAAGAALTAKGKATKATAGLTRQAVKKSVETVGKNVQRGWNRVKRNVKNRMKKVGAAIKNIPQNIKNMPKNIRKKFLKATRRSRARKKYRQQKASGHGPANWKPTRRERRSNPEPRRSESEGSSSRATGTADGNRMRAVSTRTVPGKPTESRGRRISRGIANAADALEAPADNALDTVDQSFSDDPGNSSG